jgi:hypothetical protein
MRPDLRNLVLKTLLCKGPLTDAELAWWIGEVLRQNPSSAKKKRRELTKAGAVRFTGNAKMTPSGHLQKRWELAPEIIATLRPRCRLCR